jgi:hypothetical protein
MGIDYMRDYLLSILAEFGSSVSETTSVVISVVMTPDPRTLLGSIYPTGGTPPNVPV